MRNTFFMGTEHRFSEVSGASGTEVFVPNVNEHFSCLQDVLLGSVMAISSSPLLRRRLHPGLRNQTE